MSNLEDVKSLVRALDAETNTQASKVDAVIADLKSRGGAYVSQADLDEIVSGLASISARLKVLGANTADPIPDSDGGPLTGAEAFRRAHDGK